MQYLQRVYDLAEARGYFRCPEVLALQDRVPDWFRALGTAAGIADFEARRGVRVPAALREFYGWLPLACFIEAPMDGEVFLADFATIVRCELPPLVTWSSEQFLVFAFHGHSGTVCAVPLGSNDPRVFWGCDADSEPYEDARPSVLFSELVFESVNSHERRLDRWQAIYESSLGGVEWVRRLPGMAKRLGGAPHQSPTRYNW